MRSLISAMNSTRVIRFHRWISMDLDRSTPICLKRPKRHSTLRNSTSRNGGSSRAMARRNRVPSDDQDEDCAVKVIVRARPPSIQEVQSRSKIVVHVSSSAIQIVHPSIFQNATFLEALPATLRLAIQSDPTTFDSLAPEVLAAAISAGHCHVFHYDRCFGATYLHMNGSGNEGSIEWKDEDAIEARSNQEMLFEQVGKNMIVSAFEGFNCTILAYGQTGSGKTHSMVGDGSETGRGLVPRVCETLFEEIEYRRKSELQEYDTIENDLLESVETGSKTVYNVQVSYCEIYKEKVNDLLDESTHVSADPMDASTHAGSDAVQLRGGDEFQAGSPAQRLVPAFGSYPRSYTSSRRLKVREHPVTGPFVEGLSSKSVVSYSEIAEELLAGDRLRTVASTRMNAVSSRSHAIFTITLTQTVIDNESHSAHNKTAKICLVDLAGSERADASETSGDRLKEGAMINQSLTTLGRVISSLSRNSANRVPYRDSTLTWLLKESLGGNAKTTMIAMISPSADNYEETMSTLRYAESAKRVVNRAVVNEDKNAKVIRQLREEIQQLKDELARVKSRRGSNHEEALNRSILEHERAYSHLKLVQDEEDQMKHNVESNLQSSLPKLIQLAPIREEVRTYELALGHTVLATQSAITRSAKAPSSTQCIKIDEPDDDFLVEFHIKQDDLDGDNKEIGVYYEVTLVRPRLVRACINNEQLPEDQEMCQLTNGDQLQLSTITLMLEAKTKQKPVPVSPLITAENPFIHLIHKGSLRDLVAQANNISTDLGLSMAFYDNDDDENTISVAKTFGDGRSTVSNWTRKELEMQLCALLQLQATLSRSSQLVPTTKVILPKLDASTISSSNEHDGLNKTHSVRPDDTQLKLLERSEAQPRQCTRLVGCGRIYLSSIGHHHANGSRSFESHVKVALFDSQGSSVGQFVIKVSESTSSSKVKASSRLLNTLQRVYGQPLHISTQEPIQVSITILSVHLLKEMAGDLVDNGISMTLTQWTKSKSSSTKPMSTGHLHESPRDEESTLTFDVNQPFSFIRGSKDSKASGASQDDFIRVELWGYSLPNVLNKHVSESGSHDATEETVRSIPQLKYRLPLEFFISVDIEERDSDGVFNPVDVKADGSLRLRVKHARRLAIRVTQADQKTLVLKKIVGVYLLPPFAIQSKFGSYNDTTYKSAQNLVASPRASSQHSTLSASSASGTLKEAQPNRYGNWVSLDHRSENDIDESSRSVSTTAKWDKDLTAEERVDGRGRRGVFRVVIAFVTSVSSTPIIVSKSVTTKLKPSSTSTRQKIAHEVELGRSKNAIYGQISRDYRLGTWYAVDVVMSTEKELSNEGGATSNNLAQLEPKEADTMYYVESYIQGLQRLENVLDLERIRQYLSASQLRLLKEGNDVEGKRSANVSAEDALRCFKHLGALADGYQIVSVDSDSSDAAYIAQENNKKLKLRVDDAYVQDLSAQETELESFKQKPCERHIVHFVTEPCLLWEDGGAEMSGFLMFTQTSRPSNDTFGKGGASTYADLKSSKAMPQWGRKHHARCKRRWFVLRRPFLYAYKSYDRHEQIGVLDISRCQLLTGVAKVGSDASGIYPSVHPNAGEPKLGVNGRPFSSSSLGSKNDTGILSRSRSSHLFSKAHTNISSTVSNPFAFQLVGLSGSKYIVWSLQASTTAEMRAWLMAIDPLRLKAREDIVNSQCSKERPVLAA